MSLPVMDSTSAGGGGGDSDILVAATAAVGTHPTGMHSRCN